eukprot:3019357-Prymnesium_polylepis.1
MCGAARRTRAPRGRAAPVCRCSRAHATSTPTLSPARQVGHLLQPPARRRECLRRRLDPARVRPGLRGDAAARGRAPAHPRPCGLARAHPLAPLGKMCEPIERARTTRSLTTVRSTLSMTRRRWRATARTPARASARTRCTRASTRT